LLAKSLFLLVTTASLNFLVNPFGAYPIHLFEAIVMGSRGPKLSLYQRRTPAIVVLGSSRSFTMEPGHIEARTSRPAFNAAVHVGGTRDYLDFARCFAARRSFPSVVIVGLGVEQVLRQARPVEADDPLATCSGEEGASVRTWLRNHRRLLTLEETWAALRSLALEVTGRPAPTYMFLADGLIRNSAYRPLDEALEVSLAGQWRPSTFDVDTLNPQNLEQLRSLLELCRDRGARVIVYLPPYHPRALARYLQESRFESLRAQLLAQLGAWSKRYPLQFYDFTDVRQFGGRPDMFYDASHPREDACRLMLDIMLSGLT
jgi:hypothetical protein